MNACRMTMPTGLGLRGWLLLVVALVLGVGALFLVWMWPAGPLALEDSTPVDLKDPALVARGRYLARVGNCAACHTARGGAPYAGGRGMATPFGTVYSSNLTPSPEGLGGWGASDFWRAMHHGQSRDGRWLYPAFPFPNMTHVTRTDSDALFAYLQSLPAVAQSRPAHRLAWPYNTQVALKVWRTLYFRVSAAPASASGESAIRDGAARGAYLVRGLGHCSACHAPRDAWGGGTDMLALSGGLIPTQNWYAPSLTDPGEAGVQDWPAEAIVALFRGGRSGMAQVTGPMAEVVQHSTQYWSDTDLRAMAAYLKQLPRMARAVPSSLVEARPGTAGWKLYGDHCAACHGERGEGVRGNAGDFAYPPLTGNRAVTMASPANLVQLVLQGGFAPSTGTHPRPFGMPPFVLKLSDADIAAVLTHVRTSWGNRGLPVSELMVQQLRGVAAP